MCFISLRNHAEKQSSKFCSNAKNIFWRMRIFSRNNVTTCQFLRKCSGLEIEAMHSSNHSRVFCSAAVVIGWNCRLTFGPGTFPEEVNAVNVSISPQTLKLKHVWWLLSLSTVWQTFLWIVKSIVKTNYRYQLKVRRSIMQWKVFNDLLHRKMSPKDVWGLRDHQLQSAPCLMISPSCEKRHIVKTSPESRVEVELLQVQQRQ